MKNSNHLDAGKHPFTYASGSRKTPQPATASMQGITSRAKGVSAPGQAANAAMRSKPSKK